VSPMHWNRCLVGVRRHLGGGWCHRLGPETSQTPQNRERSGSRRELGRGPAESAPPDTDHYKQLQESDGV